MKRLTRTYSPGIRQRARTLRQQGFTYSEIIANWVEESRRIRFPGGLVIFP